MLVTAGLIVIGRGVEPAFFGSQILDLLHTNVNQTFTISSLTARVSLPRDLYQAGEPDKAFLPSRSSLLTSRHFLSGKNNKGKKEAPPLGITVFFQDGLAPSSFCHRVEIGMNLDFTAIVEAKNYLKQRNKYKRFVTNKPKSVICSHVSSLSSFHFLSWILLHSR